MDNKTTELINGLRRFRDSYAEMADNPIDGTDYDRVTADILGEAADALEALTQPVEGIKSFDTVEELIADLEAPDAPDAPVDGDVGEVVHSRSCGSRALDGWGPGECSCGLKWRSEIAEQQKEIEALRAEREWIGVDDELPDPGKKVIVYYKNYNGLGRTIMAYHAPRWTIESDAEAETYDEYNEVLDCYYAMPGWYEQIDNWPDYASCFVNEGEITHWKPAPPEPEQNND